MWFLAAAGFALVLSVAVTFLALVIIAMLFATFAALLINIIVVATKE